MTTIQENSNNLISRNMRMTYVKPSIESNDKNLEMKNQPDFPISINHHQTPFQPFQRDNSNSLNKYGKIKIISQINNNKLPQINQNPAQFSTRNQQIQPNRNYNNKQNYNYLYYQGNQNGNNLVGPSRFKIEQIKDESGSKYQKNQGYYQENLQFEARLEGNQQSNRSPRSINNNQQNQFHIRNLYQINSKTQGEKNQGHHLEKLVENTQEKSQRLYQIPSNIQSKYQFQNKKAPKVPTQEVENEIATTSKEPLEITKENNDDDTVFQTIQQPCTNCSQVTEEELISLSCLHYYHFSCLQEQIQLQLNRANFLRLLCQCGKQIKQKIVQQISEVSMDKLFERQLEQIYKQKCKQMWKCSSCNFFCVNSSQKFEEIFCPKCSNHELQ